MKLDITIDLGKLDKSRIVERTFTNKAGEEVTVKEYKLTAIPKKEKRVIKSGNTWEWAETHLIVNAQTKDEREQRVNTGVVGTGTQMLDIGSQYDIVKESSPF